MRTVLSDADRVVQLLQVYGCLNRGPNATVEEESLRDECVRDLRGTLFGFADQNQEARFQDMKARGVASVLVPCSVDADGELVPEDDRLEEARAYRDWLAKQS